MNNELKELKAEIYTTYKDLKQIIESSKKTQSKLISITKTIYQIERAEAKKAIEKLNKKTIEKQAVEIIHNTAREVIEEAPQPEFGKPIPISDFIEPTEPKQESLFTPVTEEEQDRFGGNTYEERKERKLENYQRQAQKNVTLSNQYYKESHDLVSNIPMGQPILVGHHSEARHRKTLENSWNKMGKSVEASKKAEHYERKAESVASNRAISSDDPEAITKLRTKIKDLKEAHNLMKEANKAFKADKMEEFLDKHPALKNNYKIYTDGRKPFATWALSNSNQNIRSAEKRLEELEKKATMETVSTTINDTEIVFNVEANRVQIFFDGKPSTDTRKELKSNGFRWAPSIGAWQTSLHKWKLDTAVKIVEAM
jgi:hypothetical protein